MILQQLELRKIEFFWQFQQVKNAIWLILSTQNYNFGEMLGSEIVETFLILWKIVQIQGLKSRFWCSTSFTDFFQSAVQNYSFV